MLEVEYQVRLFAAGGRGVIFSVVRNVYDGMRSMAGTGGVIEHSNMCSVAMQTVMTPTHLPSLNE